MAIRINLESLEIPVQIGDFSFIVKIDDDSFSEMNDAFVQAMEDTKKATDFDSIIDAIVPAYDAVFGEGVFDQIYEVCKSAPILSKIIIETYTAIQNEYKRRMSRDHTVRNKKKCSH